MTIKLSFPSHEIEHNGPLLPDEELEDELEDDELLDEAAIQTGLFGKLQLN